MSLFVIVSQRESMLLVVIKFNISLQPARSDSESPDILKCLQQLYGRVLLKAGPYSNKYQATKGSGSCDTFSAI